MQKLSRKFLKNTRFLAAIMFTDIVGFTAMMEEDEQKAIEEEAGLEPGQPVPPRVSERPRRRPLPRRPLPRRSPGGANPIFNFNFGTGVSEETVEKLEEGVRSLRASRDRIDRSFEN